MRTCTFLLLSVAAVIYAVGTPATGCGESYENQELHIALEDGWEPIKNINDQHIKDLGIWAVSEFLKTANCKITFNKVVSGMEQVVSGMNYELVINASDVPTGKPGNYTARLYEQEWTKTRKLISFHKDK
jgi:hypothetical protein